MSLTHLNARGEAHMVDIADKPESRREALASGYILMIYLVQSPDIKRRKKCTTPLNLKNHNKNHKSRTKKQKKHKNLRNNRTKNG